MPRSGLKAGLPGSRLGGTFADQFGAANAWCHWVSAIVNQLV